MSLGRIKSGNDGLFLLGFPTNSAFREHCGNGESKSGNSGDNNSGKCEETSPTKTIDRNYQRFDLLRAAERALRERKVRSILLMPDNRGNR